MENKLRERQRKSYITMRTIYDVTMVILLLSVGVVMFFGEYMKLPMIADTDKVFRYFFGTICILYGSFRLYLVIKQDY